MDIQNHRQQIRDTLRLIRNELNSSKYFAAEARALKLVDLIRTLPDVSVHRKVERPQLHQSDYLTSTPDA